MKTLPIDRPTLDDPLYSQKNPHQTFLLLFSLFAAAPLIAGGESPSRVLDQKLAPALVLIWGLALLIGSTIALVGEFWRGHTWTGLVLERAGLIIVSGIGAFYSSVIYFTADDPAGVRYITGVTAAYAASCLWRVIQITLRLRWIRGVIAEVNRSHE